MSSGMERLRSLSRREEPMMAAEKDSASAPAEALLENPNSRLVIVRQILHPCSAGRMVLAAAARASDQAWLRDRRLHGGGVDYAGHGLCACGARGLLSVLGARRRPISGGVQRVR